MNRPERPSEAPEPFSEENLVRALNHQLRREILRRLHSSDHPLSPTQIERELELNSDDGNPLSNVSYHTKVLAELGAVHMVDTRMVRGAQEHFYASRVSDTAWVLGLLSSTRKSDEAKLWPDGRPQPGKSMARRRQKDG